MSSACNDSSSSSGSVSDNNRDTVTVEEVNLKLDKMSSDIDNVQNDLGGLLKLMNKLEANLHPQHYLCFRVADHIVDLGWTIVKNRPINSFALFNFEPFIQAQVKCYNFASKELPGGTTSRAKYMYFGQMIQGIRLTQRAVYCNQNYMFDEAQTIEGQLQNIHQEQKRLIEMLYWGTVGSWERSVLDSLVKSESDLAEILRTSFTADILKPENIERLRRAFSYFCNQVYNLPYPFGVDCSSLPLVKFKQYKDFFGY